MGEMLNFGEGGVDWNICIGIEMFFSNLKRIIWWVV